MIGRSRGFSYYYGGTRSKVTTTPLHLLGDPSRTAFTTAPHPTLWGQDARRRYLDATRGVAPPPRATTCTPLRRGNPSTDSMPFFLGRFRPVRFRVALLLFAPHLIVPLHAAPVSRNSRRTLLGDARQSECPLTIGSLVLMDFVMIKRRSERTS